MDSRPSFDRVTGEEEEDEGEEEGVRTGVCEGEREGDDPACFRCFCERDATLYSSGSGFFGQFTTLEVSANVKIRCRTSYGRRKRTFSDAVG